MANFLNRELAPITDAAWKLIDAEAARILKGNLSGRALVDFSGPHGLTTSAVNLGSVKPAASEAVKGVAWSVRQVLPLVEARAAFALSLSDLDQLPRGGAAPDLSAVVAAAQRAALFEEKAVYSGLPGDGYDGLLSASSNKPVALPKNAADYLSAFEAAVHTLQQRGIAGPYHLALGRDPYRTLAVGVDHGYPLNKRLATLLEGGAVRWSPALTGGALVSGRGGDFELTVGQDYAVGYEGREGDRLDLYLIASFAFRVLEPAAAVAIKA